MGAQTGSTLMALTRAVSPAFDRCELTHAPRVPVDVARAIEEHEAYEQTLARLGCTVQRLPASADLPDSVFIEDIAIVLDDIAVIARPGAESRRAEVPPVEEALKHHRLLGHITPPGTLDGGDVLVAGRRIFVGASSRTNAAGVDQLRRTVEYFGFKVDVVPVRQSLHLKSAVTLAADGVLLINPAAVPREAFDGFELIEVDPGEPLGANVLRVGNTLVAAAAYPRTRERLEARGLTVVSVDVGEIAKAEGAVTCCSLVFAA